MQRRSCDYMDGLLQAIDDFTREQWSAYISGSACGLRPKQTCKAPIAAAGSGRSATGEQCSHHSSRAEPAVCCSAGAAERRACAATSGSPAGGASPRLRQVHAGPMMPADKTVVSL